MPSACQCGPALGAGGGAGAGASACPSAGATPPAAPGVAALAEDSSVAVGGAAGDAGCGPPARGDALQAPSSIATRQRDRMGAQYTRSARDGRRRDSFHEGYALRFGGIRGLCGVGVAFRAARSVRVLWCPGAELTPRDTWIWEARSADAVWHDSGGIWRRPVGGVCQIPVNECPWDSSWDRSGPERSGRIERRCLV